MSNVWERFDGIATPEEVEEAKSNFAPLEEGEYKVILEKIEAGESQQGLPQLKSQFRTIEGNRVIFYNEGLQVIGYPDITAQNIAKVVKFVSGLLHEEIEYKGLSDLADIISTVPTGTEHVVKVSYAKKDKETKKYPKLTYVSPITEDGDFFAPVEDEDVPF